MQGYNLEIRHIPGKRNPADTLSRQDKKDALGRKTVVHDANTDVVRELHVPSDADDSAIQEALMKLFSAQVQNQIETASVEGQAVRAKRPVSDSDQALKASVSDSVQSSSDQPESELKPSRSVQFKTSVPVSSNSPSSSHCKLAMSKSSVEIDNSLRERINSLLRKEILYKDIIEEMESTGRNELKRGQEKFRIQKTIIDDSCH